MLHFNVLFGGISLLALYAFASRLVKPRWALIAATTVALSMPLIYFSRDTYTEPLALTFTFAALALLWDAVKTGRPGLWLLAGVAAGAGTLTRIDAYLTIAAFIVFTIIYLALSPAAKRKKAINLSAALAIGMIVTSFLGWYDVSHLSTDYYNGQRHLLLPEILLVIVLAVAGIALVLYDWRTGLHERLNKVTETCRSTAMAGLVLVAFVILASRPLWLTERKIIGDSLQRSYAENTVGWVSWYIGPILLVAAVLGMAWLAYKAMKDRSLLLLAFLLVVGATALVYFVTPDVAPDQIWASRRFLPVVIPGFAVFGAAALAWLYSRKNIRWLLGADGKVVVTVLVTLTLLGQLFVSWPIVFAREYTLRATVVDTCRALPPKAAVLWVGGASTLLVEPTKALCGVPVEGYGQIFTKTKPTQDSLVEAARNAVNSGYIPVIGVYSSDIQLLPAGSQLTHVGTYSSKVLDPAFTHPPRHVSTASDGIELGWISPNGQIVALPEPD